jgi:hypothetical protein
MGHGLYMCWMTLQTHKFFDDEIQCSWSRWRIKDSRHGGYSEWGTKHKQLHQQNAGRAVDCTVLKPVVHHGIAWGQWFGVAWPHSQKQESHSSIILHSTCPTVPVVKCIKGLDLSFVWLHCSLSAFWLRFTRNNMFVYSDIGTHFCCILPLLYFCSLLVVNKMFTLTLVYVFMLDFIRGMVAF